MKCCKSDCERLEVYPWNLILIRIIRSQSRGAASFGRISFGRQTFDRHSTKATCRAIISSTVMYHSFVDYISLNLMISLWLCHQRLSTKCQSAKMFFDQMTWSRSEAKGKLMTCLIRHNNVVHVSCLFLYCILCITLGLKLFIGDKNNSGLHYHKTFFTIS